MIEWGHHRPTRFGHMIGAPGGSREKKVVCPVFFPFSVLIFHFPVSTVPSPMLCHVFPFFDVSVVSKS